MLDVPFLFDSAFRCTHIRILNSRLGPPKPIQVTAVTYGAKTNAIDISQGLANSPIFQSLRPEELCVGLGRLPNRHAHQLCLPELPHEPLPEHLGHILDRGYKVRKFLRVLV